MDGDSKRISRLKLLGTGFLQVIFVAANTVFISRFELAGNAVTALLISYIWSWNVKRVAFGDEGDRWAYAIGACVGSVSGTFCAWRLLA